MRITKIVFMLIMVLINTPIFAQGVSINNTGAIPDASSMLDISSSDLGLLIPRIALTDTSDAVTIPSPAHSLIIFNTGLTGGLSEGFYYNEGNSVAPHWVELVTNPMNQNFNMAGNKIINLATCTDDHDAANKAYVDAVAGGGGGSGSYPSFTQVSTDRCSAGCSFTVCRDSCTSLGIGWHIPTIEEEKYLFSGFIGIPSDGWINAPVWSITPGWYGLVGSPSGVFQYGKFVTLNEVTGSISYGVTSSTYSCRCVK